MSLGAISLILAAVVVLTAMSIATFRRLAVSWNVVARPNPVVQSHKNPVPYLGGPAVFAVLFPVLFWVSTLSQTAPGDRPQVRWGCAAAVLAIGLLDDVRPLRPLTKLIALSGVCTAYLLILTPPTTPSHYLGFGLKLGFMLVIVNAFNLVDVMDGLLILVACVGAVGLLGGTFLDFQLNRIECQVLLATLVAAFWFNRPQARIFLGDAGSLSLGFLLVSLYLAGFSASAGIDRYVHLGAFAIPLLELALVVPARVHRGLSPFRGSPDHFALRLQEQRGWSKERVLMTTLMIGLLFDAWCFVPVNSIRGPLAVSLVAASIALAVFAYGYCWRLAPTNRKLACNVSA